MRRRIRLLASNNLVPVAALVAAGFLLVLAVATIVYGTQIYTSQITRDTTIQARILASTVTAVLAFVDTKTAKEYVNALAANPAVQAVAIYDAGGRQFVSFSRDRLSNPPAAAPPAEARIANDRLNVVVPVMQGGRKLGTVYLQTEIEPVGRRLARFGLIAILAIMTALVVAGLGVSQRDLANANAELEKRASELGKINAHLQVQIDQRERVEAALRQSQKMEAIGQLTGGIAHDFNNLLQIITGSLDMVRRRSARWDISGDAAQDFDRLVHAAQEGAKRAAALTHQLLAFSRRQPLAPKAVDVNKLVLGISSLIGRSIGETIAIETILAAGLWPVWTDPNQLESAIVNLAVNARDAMPGGGKLTIETANAHLDEAYVVAHEDVRVGQYVVVAVTDSGVGMSKDIVAQVFEPFFTTKQPGQGTGLGLSQVYGFTKQSGGHIKIYSEPGHGTTVKLYLPRLLTARDEIGEAVQERAAQPAVNRATILVVEDEEAVRASSVEMLRELGYGVFEAGDGPDALQILEQQPEIELLLTDVVLPAGMNGRQLAEEALRRRPNLKVLYTTGYARNAIVHHGRLVPGVDLLSKPFSYSALAAKVREVLEGTE
jgi:signal transduction histidine kinase/ActR/RegA family two-component response regulator